MEIQYISYGYLQNHIKDHYFQYKKKLTVLKAIQNLIHSGNSSYENSQTFFSRLWSHLSDDEFIELISKLPLPLINPKDIRIADEIDNAFFPLLTQKDLLSNFFCTILYNESSSNYLLFSTGNAEDVKLIIKNLFMEYNKEDTYSNNGCISWVNLLFSFILRNFSESVRFYKYDLSTDFHLIMQYIKQNYRFLTLSSLANFFNYSESHLSSIIKNNTGLSFIKLITSLKMSDAIYYLKNSDMSIEKIGELIGYNSSDHFSRTFKKYYGSSPQQYRKSFN